MFLLLCPPVFQKFGIFETEVVSVQKFCFIIQHFLPGLCFMISFLGAQYEEQVLAALQMLFLCLFIFKVMSGIDTSPMLEKKKFLV